MEQLNQSPMTDLDERGIAAGLHGALGQLSVAREDFGDANALDRESLHLLRKAERAIEKLIEAAEKKTPADENAVCTDTTD